MKVDLEALAALGVRMVEMTPHAASLGLKFVSVEPDAGTLMVPYRQELVGDPRTGVLAGGVITALLDHACGLAVKAAAFDTDPTATLDLRIDYMRPAEPRRDVIARAHCYRLTHTIAFVRAAAFEDDPDDPIATAQAAFVRAGAAPPVTS